MPPVKRTIPPYQQIIRDLEDKITSGELRPGDSLPSVRQLAADSGVSVATAQRSVAYLVAAKLVVTSATGTNVADHRLKRGPQQQVSEVTQPHVDRVDVRSADLVTAPEYVVPILGLTPGADGVTRVIRREQVAYEDSDRAVMLTVSWFAPEMAEQVPELLARMPAGHPGGMVRLIEERGAARVVRGEIALEARGILDDGREGPLLGLPIGSPCLAEVHVWYSADDAIEYTEVAMIPGRVITVEFTVGGASDAGDTPADS